MSPLVFESRCSACEVDPVNSLICSVMEFLQKFAAGAAATTLSIAAFQESDKVPLGRHHLV